MDLKGPGPVVAVQLVHRLPSSLILLADNSVNPKLVRVHKSPSHIFKIVFVHINTSLTYDIAKPIEKNGPHLSRTEWLACPR